MKQRHYVLGAACALSVLFGSMQAQAGDLDGYQVVALGNGPNTIALPGHRELLAFRASRENYNAHGFEAVTFYMDDTSAGKPLWSIVPVFVKQSGKASEDERPQVSVSGGADCLLNDFRLLRAGQGKPLRLVIAHRDFGESYADDAPVHFEFYELTENKDEDVGYPQFYFHALRTVTARAKYCDVNAAFDKELHLGEGAARQVEQ